MIYFISFSKNGQNVPILFLSMFLFVLIHVLFYPIFVLFYPIFWNISRNFPEFPEISRNFLMQSCVFFEYNQDYV